MLGGVNGCNNGTIDFGVINFGSSLDAGGLENRAVMVLLFSHRLAFLVSYAFVLCIPYLCAINYTNRPR